MGDGILRDAKRREQPAVAFRYPAVVERWAVIVGISRYRHDAWNLNYAHRDAQAMCDLLRTPSGGAFDDEHIVTLVDEEATTPAITRALRSFLKKPAPEDVVILYFACHGAPDPDRPDNLYLLTHDADPKDVAGTALPMREVDLCLRETLQAERVIVVADTCHSGGLGIGARRRAAGDDAAQINHYLEQLSRARGGVAMLTSAAANESSEEDERWAGGHGVFTHFLLEGMRGAADGFGSSARDGKVGLGELFEYVRDSVRKETENRQHPVIGATPFDPHLPIAITGKVNALELFDLGLGLKQLATWLDDPKRFLAAAAQLREAIDLSRTAGDPLPQAELELGCCLLEAGQGHLARQALAHLIETGSEEAGLRSWFWLGIVAARSGDPEGARTALENFLERAPKDELAPWAREYSRRGRSRGHRHALLIGINTYSDDHFPALAGCRTDVRLMSDALTACGGFQAEDLTTLIDAYATRQRVLDAFGQLAERAGPADQVFVLFSGHSIPASQPEVFGVPATDVYLVVHDTAVRPGRLCSGISDEELHRAMSTIRSEQKTLVLDTHPSTIFNELARDGDYTVLLASDSAELAYEHTLTVDGQQVVAGLFTAALTQQLRLIDPSTLTYGGWLDSVLDYMLRAGRDQTPLLIGDRTTRVFDPEEVHLGALAFAQRRNYDALSAETVVRRYERLNRGMRAPLPEFHYSVGRALAEKGRCAEAMTALTTAIRQRKDDANTTVALTAAQLGTGETEAALQTLRGLTDKSDPAAAGVLGSLIERLERFEAEGRHALVVGVGRYADPEIPLVEGAVADATAMHAALLRYCGFRAENSVLLLDGDATRSTIMEQLTALTERAREVPAFFYFAGHGSNGPYGIPTLVPADGRGAGAFDLALPELAEIARPAAHLLAVLDAGWTGYTEYHEGTRVLQPDPRPRTSSRDLRPGFSERELHRDELQIGSLTLYHSRAISMRSLLSSVDELEIRTGKGSDRPALLDRGPGVHGWLTYALIRALPVKGRTRLTVQDWLDRAREELADSDSFVVIGEGLDQRLFYPSVLVDALLEVERSRTTALLPTLKRLVGERDRQGDPCLRLRLDLGLLQALAGRVDKSIETLDNVIQRTREPETMASDPNAETWLWEAYYHTGRLRLASGRELARAVSALDKAREIEPDNPRVAYYLGQAIRELVEEESLEKATSLLRQYLKQGAPLGHEDEVREFLGSRHHGASRQVER